MTKVEIYTTGICPFCLRAKQLLQNRNIPFIEIRVDIDPEKREEMLARSGGKRTVPQIFINDQSIGGSDDLYALSNSGKLDTLLNT